MEVNVSSISRLNEIILRAMNVENTKSIKYMWASVFDIDHKDIYGILINLAEINKIIENVIEQINSIEGIDKEMYLKPITTIQQAVQYLNLNSQALQFQRVIDDYTMLGFKFCIDIISKEKGNLKVNEEEIKKIQQEIEEFIEEIINSGTADELKDFILKNLNNTRDAIINYRIRGLEGLKDSMERSVGQIICNKQIINENNGSDFVKRIFGILAKIEVLTSIANNGQSLLEPVSKFFLDK